MSGKNRKYCSNSCNSCRVRKKKCDKDEICQNCTRLGVRCERVAQDQRTQRPSTKHVKQLQDVLANMESTLAQVYELAQDANQGAALVQIKKLFSESSPHPKHIKQRKKIPVSFDASSGGEYSVFGPTSAFTNLVGLSEHSLPTQIYNDVLINKSQLVICLENFFNWMYPDVTVFIHRESFLDEFLNPGRGQSYCSEELVYAIAALGAKCSHSQDLRELSKSYFETARNKILTSRICIPQINTLQALLCLSLYELGEGNASASWMLSGMAIRMGYDLGFQLDPKDWSLDTNPLGGSQQELITNINVMVRSRIYWGCYIVDHFVSLIMGRPVTVRKTEASVPTSEVLPNATNIDRFIFQPVQSPHSVRNLDAFQTIEPLCLLSECIGSLLTDIYTGDSTDESLSYLNKIKLAKYNRLVAGWRRKLPVSLRWSNSSLKKQDYNPTVANYRLFYYIVVICLNRPFLHVPTDEFLNQSPQTILDTATCELSLFLHKFNESGSPPSILIVYSSILGLSIILMQLQGISENHQISQHKIDDLKVFYATVSNACVHWRLAAKSMLYVEKKVKDINHPHISKIFESVTELLDQKLTDPESPEFGLYSDDLPFWTNQDNLFANFFDFVDNV